MADSERERIMREFSVSEWALWIENGYELPRWRTRELEEAIKTMRRVLDQRFVVDTRKRKTA